jgi:chromosomal replication initiator protein
VRDLEGAIVSIIAQSTFRNVQVDLSLADKVVANLVTVRPMTITLEQIRSTVCEYFNIDEKDIQTNSRKKEIVIARQIAMYLSKQYTNNSLNAIGNAIGKRNHATVSHALQAVKNQLETDRDFKAAFNAIETKLRNGK